MPKAWRQHRSALALTLLFPWFPISPPLPSETTPPAAATEAGVAGEPQTTAATPEEPLVSPGVVIEEITKGSALENAGLQVGDVILSWERLPNPPANPEGASGKIDNPFDWMWLEIEQAPRGVLVLRGRGGMGELVLRVEPGLWEAKVRPVLSRGLEDAYLAEKAQFVVGDTEGGMLDWQSLRDGLGDESGGDLTAWIALRIGAAWEEKGDWVKAIASFSDGLTAAASPVAQMAVWQALGKAHDKREEYDAAKESYTSALKISQKFFPSSIAVSTSLNSLGEVAAKREDLELANDLFLRSLEIRERLAPQSLAVAETVNNLGFVAGTRGDLDLAHSYLNRSLEIREQLAPQSLVLAESFSNIGFLAEARGDLERAQRYLRRTLEIREQLAPQSLDVAQSLNNMGAISQDRGDLRDAYDYFFQALQIEERIAPLSLQMTYSLSGLGAVAMARGELGRADDFFRQALKIRQRLVPDSLGVATILTNLGNVVEARGELDRAYDYHLQALRIREKLAPYSLSVATALNNLGSVARSRGELDRAYNYQLQALQIREQLAPQSLDTATGLNNLGLIFRTRGDPDRAIEYYLKALRIYEQLAPKSLHVGSILNNLGMAALDRKELDRAHDYHSQALQIREQLAPQSLAVAESLHNLGSVARERLDLDRAHDLYLSALRIEERLAPNSLTTVISLNRLGDIDRALGKLNFASDYYYRALEALEYQVSRLGGAYNVQAGFQAQQREFFHDMLDIHLIQGRLSEAFHIRERFRAQTFLVMLAERDTAFTADIPEELDRERRRLGVQYDRTLKKLAGLSPLDHSEEMETTRQELQELDDEAGDIEARIRQASPRLAALQYPHSLSEAETQQALDPGTLLLSYSVGKEKTALFVLSPSGDLEVKILPVAEEALRFQVKQLLILIRETVQGSSLGALRQRRVQAASRDLYTLLLGPVAERIAASKRLLILPDGPLHALPFAALVRDAGGDEKPDRTQYLAEWKPLHVALSTTVFSELKQRRHAGESNTPRAPTQLAAFGDPVYPKSLSKAKGDSTAALPTAAGVIAQVDVPRGDPIVRSAAERGIFDWRPLPYTRREVEGIARLFPTGTARTFLGPEALEDRIKSLDPTTRILHLAAHGYTDEHLPSSSFVALTIPEDTHSDAASPERDNGLLQVWEIFERVRLDADLVVLSACDTALGEEQGGEGLIGLTRAFQYAGARTVMASLWNVRDMATSELMIRFYKHLRAGLPKDEALRQAQIELIRGPIEVVNEKGEKILLDASAPYYWAAFQVYGDWQ